MNERSFKSSGIDKQSNPNYIWNFSGGSLSEVTGSGYTATAVNGPVAGADRCGNANAYVCDGVDDYIKITDNADLDPGAGNFTVSIWVKRLAAQTNWAGNQAVGKWNNGGTAGSNEWVLSINGSIGANTPGGFAIESGTTSYQALGTTTPGLNQWYHLVGMRDGDSIRFYLNGAREAAKYVGTAAVNNVGLDVLIGKLNGGFYSNSVYDDFVYYKRALTAGEVKKLYTGVGCDLTDAAAYRYAFNGKEKDDEVKLAGNSYDFGARIYDPRLGRWLALDQNQMNYPAVSPYTFSLNSPLMFYDPDGKDAVVTVQKDKDGNGIITISSIVYITGKNANAEKAEHLTQTAKEVFKEGTFKDKSGKNFTVKFDIKYSYVEDKSALKLEKGNNVLEFVDEKVTSHVISSTSFPKNAKGEYVISKKSGNEGIIGKKNTEKSEDYSTLHETLHLLGLADRYTDCIDEQGKRQTNANEGFEEDIMGKSGKFEINQVHYKNWAEKFKEKPTGEYLLNKVIDVDDKGELKGNAMPANSADNQSGNSSTPTQPSKETITPINK